MHQAFPLLSRLRIACDHQSWNVEAPEECVVLMTCCFAPSPPRGVQQLFFFFRMCFRSFVNIIYQP